MFGCCIKIDGRHVFFPAGGYLSSDNRDITIKIKKLISENDSPEDINIFIADSFFEAFSAYCLKKSIDEQNIMILLSWYHEDGEIDRVLHENNNSIRDHEKSFN